MRHTILPALAGAAALLLSSSPRAAVSQTAKLTALAELKDVQGKKVGDVRLTQTPSGVLLQVTLAGAPSGERAFHIHEVGRCDPPRFESAGAHFSPDGKGHGYHEAKGPHAGDLPNIHVPEDGRLTFEVLARNVTLEGGSASLLEGDGSALVIHAKPDDYRTEPSGNAGDRIACGVVERTRL
jgi:Cu-Zn family superoxide dismutase